MSNTTQSNATLKKQGRRRIQKKKQNVNKQIVAKEVNRNQLTRSTRATRNVLAKPMLQFADNIMNLDKGHVLPRPIPTWVQVHRLKSSKTLRQIVGPNQNHTKGAIIITTDPNDFVRIGAELTATAQIDYTKSDEESTTSSFDSNAHPAICANHTLHLTTGESIHTTNIPGNWSHIVSGQMKNGLKLFPGKPYFEFNDPANASGLGCAFHNPDNATIELEFYMLKYTMNNVLEEKSIGALEQIMGNVQAAIQLKFGWATQVETNNFFNDCAYWGLGYRITNPATIGRVPSGLTFSWNNDYVANTSVITVENPMVWRHLTLWDLMEDSNSLLRNQYNAATEYSLTACHALLSNNTPALYAGGELYAAQLPGGTLSRVPGYLEQLVQLIKRQNHRVLKTTQLKKGCAWFYVPDKMPDLFFRPTAHDVGTVDDRPFFTATWDASAITDANPVLDLVLTFKVMIEYITDEVDSIKVMSQADTGYFLSHWYGEMARYNNVVENPDHIKHFKEIASKVVNSQVVKKLGKDLISYGIKELPVLLSALI